RRHRGAELRRALPGLARPGPRQPAPPSPPGPARARPAARLRRAGAGGAGARPQGPRRAVPVPPALSARGLTKTYRTGAIDLAALGGVDVDLLEGELVVLLGVSGSGKSTLLNILGGLDVCTDGTVLYRGLDLTAADEEELTLYRRRHVGFVFQFYNLIPSLT